MNIWRINLKPDMNPKYNYDDLLNYCMKNNIIGVGWKAIDIKDDDESKLWEFVNNISTYTSQEKTSGFKAVNAIRKMQEGDLIWTRVGGRASEYYLCRVDKKIWKDREMNKDLEEFDIGNFVSAKWIKVGNEDKVPGKVVNSFCVGSTVQSICDVELISKYIWNDLTKEKSKYHKYDLNNLSKDDFWMSIGSEELECLVLLYLQTKGYYIYSSTLKRSSAQFETVMVYKDGSHKAYPQVKRQTQLKPSDYIENVEKGDKVFLFTTSEDYGDEIRDNTICITKKELEKFIKNNYELMPNNIKYWLDMIFEK